MLDWPSVPVSLRSGACVWLKGFKLGQVSCGRLNGTGRGVPVYPLAAAVMLLSGLRMTSSMAAAERSFDSNSCCSKSARSSLDAWCSLKEKTLKAEGC